MKTKLFIEFIDNKIIEIITEYFWSESLVRELEDKNDFIKIENYIIAKKEIRKIRYEKVESEEK